MADTARRTHNREWLRSKALGHISHGRYCLINTSLPPASYVLIEAVTDKWQFASLPRNSPRWDGTPGAPVGCIPENLASGGQIVRVEVSGTAVFSSII